MPRRPDKAELEFAFLLFLIVLPVGYFVLQAVLAVVGL